MAKINMKSQLFLFLFVAVALASIVIAIEVGGERMNQEDIDLVNVSIYDFKIIEDRDGKEDLIYKDCMEDYCWVYFNKTVLIPEVIKTNEERSIGDKTFSHAVVNKTGEFREVEETVRIKVLHGDGEERALQRIEAYKEVERGKLERLQTKEVLSR